jgi:hypothetical protein
MFTLLKLLARDAEVASGTLMESLFRLKNDCSHAQPAIFFSIVKVMFTYLYFFRLADKQADELPQLSIQRAWTSYF